MNRDKKLELIRNIFYRNAVHKLWFEILSCEAKPAFEVLEIGSGSGKGNQNTDYPKVSKITGIDLDPRVLQNSYLDEAYQMSAYLLTEKMPSAKFDLIYSHMVAEHIDDGKRFLSVQMKLLKKNGKLLHSTVSRYYWTSLINDFVPVTLKNYLIATLGSGRAEEDIFPAFYKLNSEADIKEICNECGWKFEIIRQDEPPGYLRRSILLMLIYMIFHKPLQLVFPSLRPTFIFKVWR